MTRLTPEREAEIRRAVPKNSHAPVGVVSDLLSEIDALREEWKRLRAACEAAIRYDEAIHRRAESGDHKVLDPGGAIAEGIDLDSLYFDWIGKAEHALRPTSQTPEERE